MADKRKDNKGFSLVELLVVIAIMVVLVGVMAPSLLRNIERSREARDIQTLDSIASAIQIALMSESAYNHAMTYWGPSQHKACNVFSTLVYNDPVSMEFKSYLNLPSGDYTYKKLFKSKAALSRGDVHFTLIDDRVTVFISNVNVQGDINN